FLESRHQRLALLFVTPLLRKEDDEDEERAHRQEQDEGIAKDASRPGPTILGNVLGLVFKVREQNDQGIKHAFEFLSRLTLSARSRAANARTRRSSAGAERK